MDINERKVQLHNVLVQYYDIEEFKTLCFKLGLKYDALRGEGMDAKARELILWMERHCQLEDLVKAVRQERPWIALEHKPEREQELRELLENELSSALKLTFQEFTSQADAHLVQFSSQVDAYLLQFAQLHSQLAEWKDLHHALHSLHVSFALCQRNAVEFGKVKHIVEDDRRRLERLMYETGINWRGCKRYVHQIWVLATSVEFIGSPYDESTGDGPEWFLTLNDLSIEIDKYLQEDDVLKMDFEGLSNQLFAFDGELEKWFLKADYNLRMVVQQINNLPRPSFGVKNR